MGRLIIRPRVTKGKVEKAGFLLYERLLWKYEGLDINLPEVGCMKFADIYRKMQGIDQSRMGKQDRRLAGDWLAQFKEFFDKQNAQDDQTKS